MTDFAPKFTTPRDWPETWKELRNIDRLLRCSICSEFFNNATVIPDCSHNYCALCIRRYLTVDSKCPSCSVGIKDSQLENNRIIDEIVKSFRKLRDQLLTVVKESETKVKNTKQEKKTNKNETRDIRTSKFFSSVNTKESTQSPTSSQKRQRKETSSEQSSNNSDLTSPILRKRLKRPSHDKDSETGGSTTDDDEICIIEKPTTPKQSPGTSSSHSKALTKSKTEMEDSVDCPVCSEQIARSKINFHLDTCLTSKDRKDHLRSTSSQPSSSPSKQSTPNDVTSSPVGANSFIPQVTNRKPLNKLVYTLLSDKQLKQKLKEHGLSIKGDKQTLVKRHQEFSLIYNSECSKPRPKSVSDIVRLVEEGEKKKKKLEHSRDKLNFERGQSQEDIDNIKDEYMSQNQEQFSRLINEVKSRKKKGENVKSVTADTKSSQKSKSHKKPSPLAPKKKKSLVVKKLKLKKAFDSDEETCSNSSADFEITGRRFPSSQRKLRSGGVSENRRKLHCRTMSTTRVQDDSSDTTSEPSEVQKSEKDTDSKVTSTTTVPDPPSPSVLNTLVSDSDQNSSDSETLMPAFGPPSPNIKQIPGTPPHNENDDGSDELHF